MCGLSRVLSYSPMLLALSTNVVASNVDGMGAPIVSPISNPPGPLSRKEWTVMWPVAKTYV
jgi:hypothetical protein